ncbi:MAG: Ig-like domain-containing protein, partial [Pseudomonadota bacterium]|nr:Ig-like domain-containing protein [Pseudomonadota bacterium]
ANSSNQYNLACFSQLEQGQFGFPIPCQILGIEHKADSRSMAIGQLNGDGYLDTVFANYDQPNQVCNSGGSFAQCQTIDANNTKSLDVALGDINNDNHLDAVFANEYQNNQLCLGDGLGHFSQCVAVSEDERDSNGVSLGFLGLARDSIRIVQPPNHGSADIDANGNIIYQPHADFKGTDQLTYQVEGASATVTIIVEAVSILADGFGTPSLPPEMTVSVNFAGSGQGHVTSVPNGLNCDSTQGECTATYDTVTGRTVTEVELIPEAYPGSTFKGWINNEECQQGKPLSMIKNYLCTAYFELLPKTLTMTVLGEGRIISEPQGLDCSDHCQQSFPANTSVQLMAIPEPRWQFKGLQGHCTNELLMDSDQHCRAIFTPRTDAPTTTSFTVEHIGSGQGSVAIKVMTDQGQLIDPDPQSITCEHFETTLQCTLKEALRLKLQATPQPGSSFVDFGADCALNDELVVDDNKTCTAQFELLPSPYILSIKKNIQDGDNDPLMNASVQPLIMTADGQLIPPAVTQVNCDDDQATEITCHVYEQLDLQIDVQLQLFPGEKIIFSGDCADQGSVFIDADKTCTLKLESNIIITEEYSLTLFKVGQGSGDVAIKVVNLDSTLSEPNPQIMSCETVTSELMICKSKAVLELKLEPYEDNNSYFAGFGEDCETADLHLDEDKYCEVAFEPLPRLTIAIEGQGQVTEPSIPIACHSDNINDQGCIYLFTPGETVTLIPQADPGWFFEQWQGDCSANGSVVLEHDKTCTASFKPEPTLTVTFAGKGRIVSKPEGINCNHETADCQKGFEINTIVQLRPFTDSLDSPAGNVASYIQWEFDHFEGDCDAEGYVVMTEDKSCHAVFQPVTQYNLSIDITGQGRVSSQPSGLLCDQLPHCHHFFAADTPVNLIASSPDPKWRFQQWAGDCSINGQVVMTEQKNCHAIFEPVPQFELTVEVIGDGRIYSSPSGIECGAELTDCQATYPQGEEVHLALTPDSVASSSTFLDSDNHWHLVNFEGDCDDDGLVILDEDKFCRVIFVLPECDHENSVGIDPQGNELESHACFNATIRTGETIRPNDSILSNAEAEILKLSADLITDPDHVGQPAHVYVVMRQKTADSEIQYMLVDSEWFVWNGDLTDLQFAQLSEPLPQTLEIPIFEGDLSQEVSTAFTFYVGYQLVENGNIFYNGIEPIRFVVEPQPPFLVDLIGLTAEPSPAGIRLSWETASELDHAGFILKRAVQDQNGQLHHPTQLTELIPAQGNLLNGATYTFEDQNVVAGKRYAYWLEDIDINGIRVIHKQHQVTIKLNRR